MGFKVLNQIKKQAKGEKSNQRRKAWLIQELIFFPFSLAPNSTGAVAGKTEGSRQNGRGRKSFCHTHLVHNFTQGEVASCQQDLGLTWLLGLPVVSYGMLSTLLPFSGSFYSSRALQGRDCPGVPRGEQRELAFTAASLQEVTLWWGSRRKYDCQVIATTF